jgi:hypothetical protein
MASPLMWRWIIVWLPLLAVDVRAQDSLPQQAISEGQLLGPAQLDALVAPIALYPDTLLAEILIASTYPLEVVQAERWVRSNTLKDDRLKAALDKQSWDRSVRSLVAIPSVLEMMSKQLEWTQKLGDAVLAQQPAVMEAVQRLRAKAYANKTFSSTREQTVVVRQENSKQQIVIELTVPEVLSIPYYNPAVVYGEWPYSDDPPYYFQPPDYIPAGIIGTGIVFGSGYLLGRWTSGGNYWGGGIHWGGGNIDINRPIDPNRPRVAHWQHDPTHRRGIRYNNPNVSQRFGAGNARTRREIRHTANTAADRLPAKRPQNVANRGERKSRPAKAGAARSAAVKGRRPARHPSHAAARARQGRHARRVHPRSRPPSFASIGRRRAGFGGGRRFAGGGFRGGGFRGGGFRGGGRRSDIRLKSDIVLLGYLNNGLGYYRFKYRDAGTVYVGVIAQEVRRIRPGAVRRGQDGYLRVSYEMLGLELQTYQRWIASGAFIPRTAKLSTSSQSNRRKNRLASVRAGGSQSAANLR